MKKIKTKEANTITKSGNEILFCEYQWIEVEFVKITKKYIEKPQYIIWKEIEDENSIKIKSDLLNIFWFLNWPEIISLLLKDIDTKYAFTIDFRRPWMPWDVIKIEQKENSTILLNSNNNIIAKFFYATNT